MYMCQTEWCMNAYEYTSYEPGECPVCGEPLVEFDPEGPPPRAAHQPQGVTAVALSAVPYGGYELTLGDDDATQVYAGRRCRGRNTYVRQLMHDLARLGYYGPWRWGGRDSRFDWNLVGAVLAFKYDLVTHYGVTGQRENPFDRMPTAEQLNPDRAIRYYARESNPGRGSEEYIARRDLCSDTDGTRNHQVNIDGPLGRTERTLASQIRAAQRGRDPNQVRNFTTQQAVTIKRNTDAAIDGLDEVLGHADFSSLEPEEPNYETEITGLRETVAGSGHPEGTTLAPMRGNPSFSSVNMTDNVPPNVQTHLDTLMRSLRSQFDTMLDLDRNQTEGAAWLRADLTRLRGLTDPPANVDRVIDNRIQHLTRLVEVRDALYTCLRKAQVLAERCNTAFEEFGLGAFFQELRIYGTVDWSTALYLRYLVTNGSFPSGRAIYRLPVNDELIESTGETFNQICRRLCAGTRSGRCSDHVPEKLMVSVMGHESGGEHGGDFRAPHAFRTVKFGVDYNNHGVGRHLFVPDNTQPGPWVHSRGWGGSQFTTFDDPVEGVDHHDGLPFTSGNTPPVLDYIRDQEANINTGVVLFKTKFDTATREHRLCTYDPRFSCFDCVRRFSQDCLIPVGTSGDPQTGKRGAVSYAMLRNCADIRVTSSRAYDVPADQAASEMPDPRPFLPAVAQAVLDASFHLVRQQRNRLEAIVDEPGRRQPARRQGIGLFQGLQAVHTALLAAAGAGDTPLNANLRVWLERGATSLAIQRIRVESITGSTEAAPFYPSGSTAGYELEYPCSWLCAIIRYAGAGPQAWDYLCKHMQKARGSWSLGDISYNSNLDTFKASLVEAMGRLPQSGVNAFPVAAGNLESVFNGSNIESVHRDLVQLDPALSAGDSVAMAVRIFSRGGQQEKLFMH